MDSSLVVERRPAGEACNLNGCERGFKENTDDLSSFVHLEVARADCCKGR